MIHPRPCDSRGSPTIVTPRRKSSQRTLVMSLYCKPIVHCFNAGKSAMLSANASDLCIFQEKTLKLIRFHMHGMHRNAKICQFLPHESLRSFTCPWNFTAYIEHGKITRPSSPELCAPKLCKGSPTQEGVAFRPFLDTPKLFQGSHFFAKKRQKLNTICNLIFAHPENVALRSIFPCRKRFENIWKLRVLNLAMDHS